jgi:uncharacterized protein (DUF2062 family)
MKNSRFRFFQKLSADFRRLQRFRADPVDVARGTAVGVFIGVFPTFGAGIALTILISRYFRFHVPAALLAGTLSVVPPIGTGWIVLSAYVGGVDLGRIRAAMQSMSGIMMLGGETLTRYLWGCLLVSIFAAMVGYGLVRITLGRKAL